MGHAYRTPSPIREPYISSSNVNSPQTAPEACPRRYASYQHHIESRASGIDVVERDKQDVRPTAASAHLQNGFSMDSNPIDQKPGSATVTASSEHMRGSSLLGEPCTPKKKRAPMLWCGLPSPETPTFHDETALERAKDSNDLPPLPDQPGTGADSDNIEKVKTVILKPSDYGMQRDEILARKLQASISLTVIRRSTRLRTQPKPTYTNQIPDAVPKTAHKLRSSLVAPGPAVQPDFSTIPVKADPIPFEGIPAVLSLSWQLQYPPGGSTHPSYPYPAMDPRLLFEQAFVPIIGGLPDFKLVPKLVLPMDWKHVSWSGLLPIAFDPYRQAFKLTPVGPMPLTCEELHQQGLHKYTPGGELHPEYGLLPEMLKFSDGSDAEIFDFDGVNWTLPWEELMDFHAPSSEALIKHESQSYSPQASPLEFAPSIPSHYNEVWDCPDSIIDLPDAWRWLSELETKSDKGFTASPGKVWRGTGVHRVGRRFKQPIGSLMSTTIANLISNPTELFLVNQDNREFDAFKSVATPVHIDITLFRDVEFTIKELLCYFPNHYCWRKAADRFVQAGMTGGDVANMINFTRKLEGEAAKKSSTIASNLMYETSEDGIRVKIVRSSDEKSGYTAQGWVSDLWKLADYPLLALAHGLVALPADADAGPSTKLIIWCRDQGRHRTMLSDVPMLLEGAGIERRIQQPETGCPDEMLLFRHAKALKEDRKRVIASEKLSKRKRELEGEEETRRRKKKAE